MSIPPLTAANVAVLIAAFRAANVPVPDAAERDERPAQNDDASRPNAGRRPDRPPLSDRSQPLPFPRPGAPAPNPALVRQAMLAELLGARVSDPDRPEPRRDSPSGETPPRGSGAPQPSELADPAVRLALARLAATALAAAGLSRLQHPGLPADESAPAHGDPRGAVPAVSASDDLFAPDVPDDIGLIARRALDAAYLRAAGGSRLAAALVAREAPEAVLAELGRRLLFAVGSGPEDLFGKAERRAALLLLYTRAAAILWPMGQGGDVHPERLRAYVAHLDAAGPEERRSIEWIVERVAADVRFDRFTPIVIGDGDPPPAPNPATALVRSAIEAFAGGAPRPAETAVAAPVVLRETPLVAGGFLSQEMLLAALAAARRAVHQGDDHKDPSPPRRGVRRAPLAGERYIRPLEKEWRDVADALPLIEAWEAEAGLALPEAYSRFLAAFNGGHVYPNLFDLRIAGSRVSETGRLERLHDFSTVAGLWRTAAEDRRADVLPVGCDAEGAAVLLSLRPDDFGAVLLRRPSSDGARQEARLAGDFESFFEDLYDGPDLAGFRHWDRPALRRLVRRFVI